MYLSSRTPAEPPIDALDEGGGVDGAEGDPATRGRSGIEWNVVALGLTSMFTDISAEMVGSVLPLYLTLLYGFTPLQFGMFDGVYQGLAAVIALGAAVAADRRRRLKETAGIGYGISTLSTAGLVLTQGAWLGSLVSLYADRLGKGIRTAPRDAIISLSVAPGRLGRAFGLHRTFDTAGAVAGPLLASFVLARDGSDYETVFVVAFFASVVGLAALVLFVDGRRDAAAVRATSHEPVEPRRRRFDRLRTDVRVLWARPTYRMALLLGGGLALLSPGDGLIYLTFQRDASLTNAQFPLLYFGGSVVFLVGSYPVGRLADRVGRWRVFLIGEAMFAGVFFLLASGQRGPVALVVMVVLVGGRYAATDGVLMALASSTLPGSLRATGLGLLVAVLAGGHLVASSVYGSLWGSIGSSAAARAFGIAVLVAALGGALLLWARSRTVGAQTEEARG